MAKWKVKFPNDPNKHAEYPCTGEFDLTPLVKAYGIISRFEFDPSFGYGVCRIYHPFFGADDKPLIAYREL